MRANARTGGRTAADGPSLLPDQFSPYDAAIATPAPEPTDEFRPEIGMLNEGSLHAALKERYAVPGDEFEVPLSGFVIDIVRDLGGPDELLIEIQTGSFGSMARKLDRLLGPHRMLLVHPIAVRTRIDRPTAKSRRSPKRGSVHSLLDELVSFPTLLDHPALELDVVLVDVTKVQVADPKARRGRGGFRTVDRRLDEVIATHRFSGIDAIGQLLPDALPDPFTTADIAASGAMSRPHAQKLTYCLRAMQLIEETGRTRGGVQYRHVS